MVSLRILALAILALGLAEQGWSASGCAFNLPKAKTELTKILGSKAVITPQVIECDPAQIPQELVSGAKQTEKYTCITTAVVLGEDGDALRRVQASRLVVDSRGKIVAINPVEFSNAGESYDSASGVYRVNALAAGEYRKFVFKNLELKDDPKSLNSGVSVIAKMKASSLKSNIEAKRGRISKQLASSSADAAQTSALNTAISYLTTMTARLQESCEAQTNACFSVVRSLYKDFTKKNNSAPEFDSKIRNELRKFFEWYDEIESLRPFLLDAGTEVQPIGVYQAVWTNSDDAALRKKLRACGFGAPQLAHARQDEYLYENNDNSYGSVARPFYLGLNVSPAGTLFQRLNCKPVVTAQSSASSQVKMVVPDSCALPPNSDRSVNVARGGTVSYLEGVADTLRATSSDKACLDLESCQTVPGNANGDKVPPDQGSSATLFD